jgi:hypothetical protein
MPDRRGDEISGQVGRHQRGDLLRPVEAVSVHMVLQMVVVVVVVVVVVAWLSQCVLD